MKLDIERSGGVVVMRPEGRIALGQNETTMREKLRELLENGETRIVLDLGEVTFMDSSGLAELITAHVTAERHNAEVKLASVGKNIAKLLDVTKLSYVFEIFDSSEDAVRSFEERKIA